MLTTIDR